MGPSKPDLRLVPATDGFWGQYAYLCEMQHGYCPLKTDKMVLVAHEDVLLAGCTLIHTDGPYLMANGVVFNYQVEKVGQYNSAVFLQDELKKLSSTLNRMVMMVSNHQGLIRVASTHGFTRIPAELWFYNPSSTYIAPAYAEQQSTAVQEAPGTTEPPEAPVKRGRGRPKGSRNKRKVEDERPDGDNQA